MVMGLAAGIPPRAVPSGLCLAGCASMVVAGYGLGEFPPEKTVMCGLGQSEKSWSNHGQMAIFSYFLMLIRSIQI